MALLCTFVVAQSVLDVLSQQNLDPDQLDRLADQFECIVKCKNKCASQMLRGR